MTAKDRASGVSFKTAATTAVLMGLLVTANAMAASGNLVECSEMNRISQDLAVAMDELSVKVVEHIAPNQDDHIFMDDEVIRSLDLVDIDLQTDAPKLSLSPRVATMLDRIFEIDQSPVTVDESGATGLTSPLADGPTGKETVEDTPDVTVDGELQLPQLQRRMNRRDI